MHGEAIVRQRTAAGRDSRPGSVQTLPAGRRGPARAASVLAALLWAVATVHAGEVTVMTSGGFTAPYRELSAQFERVTGERVTTAATSMGSGADSIPNRIRAGEAVDVVIVADAALDDLIREGLVVPGSKVPLARSGIGMAVRAGSPKPDIGSVDALKRTLLEAKSIAYSASVSGDYLSTELFARLGIAEQLKARSRRVVGERVGAVVARGEAEIGFQQISELLPVPGIDYVGPLPPDVQLVTVFSAGVASGARNPEAARALIRHLASAAAIPVIERSGLDPIAAPAGR
jgi:molybdate transport system substrate-binding protein